MRLIIIFLTACVILALIKAAIIAILLLFVIMLIWTLCSRPRELFVFIAYCTVLIAITAHPVISVIIIAVAVIGAHRRLVI